MRRRIRDGLVLLAVGLLVGCSMLGGAKVDPFAGNWQGSGVDSEGNAARCAAKVMALDGDRYRMLILDTIDTEQEPMYVMDGVLDGGRFIYTTAGGLYEGECTLAGETLEGFYKGPVDGTFTMQRISEN